MSNTKCYIGFYIEFRQSFAKETFSYDERLKNEGFKDESHEACSGLRALERNSKKLFENRLFSKMISYGHRNVEY